MNTRIIWTVTTNSVAIMLLGFMVVSNGESAPASDNKIPDGTNNISTLLAGPERIGCVSVARQNCMLVKRGKTEEYSMFYRQIEKFGYREGTEYEMRIRVKPIENPPTGTSSLQYKLVKGITGKRMATNGSETLWLLSSYISATGDTVVLLKNSRATLEFRSGGIGGNAGCNRYFGTLAPRGGNNLTAEIGGSTMMACPESTIALGNAATYRLNGDKLQIDNAVGRTVATSTAATPATLTGPTWKLKSYNSGNVLVSSLTTQLIDVHFNPDGNLQGFAGCNNYFAAYRLDGNSIQIGPAASTRRMCANPAGVMKDETGYLKALERAAVYAIRENELILYDHSSRRVAVYQVQE